LGYAEFEVIVITAKTQDKNSSLLSKR